MSDQNAESAKKKQKRCTPCHLNPDLVERCDHYASLYRGSKEVDDGCVVIHRTPFTTGKVRNVVEATFLESLKEEVLGLDLVEKNNDLYKFRQSAELNAINLPAVSEFRKLLLNQLKPIISKVMFPQYYNSMPW